MLEGAWNALVQGIRSRLSFKQVSYYDCIGAFLLKFPGFMWQPQFVSLEQWTHTFKGKSDAQAQNFTTVLREQMMAKEKAFWSLLKRV